MFRGELTTGGSDGANVTVRGITEITEKSPTGGRKVGFALILGGVTACGPLSIDMYLPALPQLTGALSASSTAVQSTLTTVLLGLALGQLVAGPVSDSVGRRMPLLAGLVVYVVASVLCSLSGSVPLLTVLRFVQGFGAAAGMVIARAAVRDLFHGVEVTRFYSSLALVTGLSPILAPVIGGQILRYTDWRGVFVVLAGLGVSLSVVVALVLPETKPVHWRQPAHVGATLRTFSGLLREPSFLGNALAAGFAMAAMFAYASGSSFVFQNIYGMSPQTFSLVFAANAIGLVGGAQLNARLVGRVADEARLLVGALTAAGLVGAGMVIMVIAHAPLWMVFSTLFVMIASLGFGNPNMMMLALARHRETAGSASALLGVCQFVVGALSAPLVGMGGLGSALPMALVMFAVVIVALLAHAIVGRRRLPRPGVSTLVRITASG
jgi:DHA1 family bicyclomycin/chloramphenicol resistance-like MFS transporter